jgi:hypothetical protein
MKSVFKYVLVACVAVSFATTPALAEGKVFSGKRCNFSKPEKIMMVTWIFPLAGAIWTGLACKKDIM